MSELPLKKQLNPIICPICGSEELAFVPEYHKSVGYRIACVISLLFCLISAGMIIKDLLSTTNVEIQEANMLTNIFLFAFGVVFFLVFYIVIIAIEHRTHIKAICRDCGYIWLLD